jgi:hypothetical protein
MGGGLFLKACAGAQKVDLGFNPDHVLLVAVDPTLRGYSPDKARRFNQQLLRQTIGLSGVKSASLGSNVPFLSGNSWDIAIDGYSAAGGETLLSPLPIKSARDILPPSRSRCFGAASSGTRSEPTDRWS